MGIRARRAVAATLVAVVGGALTGCAGSPHALRWHGTGVTQSLSLPEYPEVWAGLPLDNVSADPITMRALHLTGVQNFTVGKPFVIDTTNGNSIDWYPPPGTFPMQAEVAHRRAFAGFVVPPHTTARFEAVVLLRARDRSRVAAIGGATATYTSGRGAWTETWVERNSLRLHD